MPRAAGARTRADDIALAGALLIPGGEFWWARHQASEDGWGGQSARMSVIRLTLKPWPWVTARPQVRIDRDRAGDAAMQLLGRCRTSARTGEAGGFRYGYAHHEGVWINRWTTRRAAHGDVDGLRCLSMVALR